MLEEEPDILEIRKTNDVRGTWVENAFQVDLRGGNYSPGSPLSIPLFSDMHPYHCVPHCGVYGLSEYHLSLPAALVCLPLGDLLQLRKLPSQILEAIESCHSQASSIKVYFIIHSCPSFSNAVDPLDRNVNILFHLWALQGLEQSLQYQEVQMNLTVGGFSPVGVSEVPPICEAEELNGLPLGHMGKRILYMHEGQLSPNNVQMTLSPDHTLHSLFTVAHYAEHRQTVLSLHLIPSVQEVEKALVESAENVSGLLHNLEVVDKTVTKQHFTTSKNFIYSACSL